MATIPLPPDFKEFLRLLGEHDVKYLLVGGYAVGYHGYVRATADMDIWVRRDAENAARLVDVLTAFGFTVPELDASLFLEEDRIVRMGNPPMRIEVQTSISGVDFDACYADRITDSWEDVEVSIISLERLKQNKRAAGRTQDLLDLEHLE